MQDANRFVKDVFILRHNARFVGDAEDAGPAFVPFTGNVRDINTIHMRKRTQPIASKS